MVRTRVRQKKLTEPTLKVPREIRFQSELQTLLVHQMRLLTPHLQSPHQRSDRKGNRCVPLTSAFH